MKTMALAPLLFLVAAHAQTVPGRRVPNGSAEASATAVRMCVAEDLSLATDDENGSFDGMSHSGTLVVLRNLSPTACRVPANPQVSFADGSGPLKATGQMAGFIRPGMGHGPVVLPVIVPAGAEVTSSLRWVSSEVYDKNVCIAPTKISVTIDGKQQTAAFGAHLCGDASKGGVTYEQSRFATDPVYTPDHTVRAPQLPRPE